MTSKILLFATGTMLWIAPAAAGPAEDAAASVARILDKFNAGDANAFTSAHIEGATIIDEFPPYRWSGPKSAEDWLASYGKDAAARGISDSRIAYGAPIRSESDGQGVYIVLPTIYSFKQGGKPMSAGGQMSFVMTRVGTGWKIAGWSYLSAPPAPQP